MDPSRAQDPANYYVVAERHTRCGGVRYGRQIAVVSAVYDPAMQTVTLHLHHRLSLFRPYQLSVNGTSSSGLTDLRGAFLDGSGTGHAGGDFVAVLHGFVGKAVSPTESSTAAPRTWEVKR